MSATSAFDLQRIRDETFVREIDFHWEIGSTNTQACQLLERTAAPQLPLLVLAEKQTQGRGRGQNRWWSTTGSLTFSLLVPLSDVPSERQPQIALTTGLAVCQAVEQFVPLADLAIKWPNDVYLDEQKLAGILIELPPRRPAVAVIGIGINANNRCQEADPELAARSVSLRDVLESDIDLSELLIACLQQVEHRLEQLPNASESLVDQWRAYHLLHGRSITIDAYGQQFIGTCLDIDDDGALLIETPTGVQRCVGGTITHFDRHGR